MKSLIDENEGRVRVQQFSAGNLVNTTFFNCTMEQFEYALQELLSDEAQQHSFDPPGCMFEFSVIEAGVRIAEWRAKSPTRTSVVLAWRDLSRFLVAGAA